MANSTINCKKSHSDIVLFMMQDMNTINCSFTHLIIKYVYFDEHRLQLSG